MVKPVAEADRFQFAARADLRVVCAGEFHRRGDIFECGHRRQQVEGLQHDPDPPAPGMRQRIFVHRREIGTGHLQAAAAGALETRQHGHQRALARARGAEQRDGRSPGDVQIDTAQDIDRRFARAE